MADLMQGTSEYLLGTNDTADVLLNNISPMDANQPNGLADAIIQIQTALGPGTDIVGALDNLAERLAVQMPANGWLIQPGDIWMTGRATAGTGWLLCNGDAVDRTTYLDLFSAIGTTFGPGNGTTTFNVPDMRGRVPVGVGTGTGGGAAGTQAPTGGTALTAIALSAWKGEETHRNTAVESGTAVHTHGVTDPGHSHTTQGGTGGAGSNALSTGTWDTFGDYSSSSVVTGLSVNNHAGAQAASAHNNLQPQMGVNFIIKT